MSKPIKMRAEVVETKRGYENRMSKMIHGLHPYPGIMNPEIARHLLVTYAKDSHVILDPFVGSGTTLIEANQIHLNCIGVDVNEFSRILCGAKTEIYDLTKLKREAMEMCRELGNACMRKSGELLLPSSELIQFCRKMLPKYQYQDALKTIISRTLFSLLHSKEKNKMMASFSRDLRLNCIDTLRRIRAFQKVRSRSKMAVIRGDSRRMAFGELCDNTWKIDKPDFIFTSPPYIGKINYHAEFGYAYGLFDLKRHDEEEIGSSRLGEDFRARRLYVKDMIAVFSNIRENTESRASALIIVEDKFNLWPEIAKGSELQIRSVPHPRPQYGEKALLISQGM